MVVWVAWELSESSGLVGRKRPSRVGRVVFQSGGSPQACLNYASFFWRLRGLRPRGFEVVSGIILGSSN